MYTDNPPLICSGLTILQMESVSDHSAVDIAANLTSHGESFFPPATPLLFEQWTSPWTPDIIADSHRPQVNAQACSLPSCGATDLHLLTPIFRLSPFVAQHALIRNIDRDAEMQHPENLITGIRDEVLPVTRRSASGSMYRTTVSWSPLVCRNFVICANTLT